MTKLTKERLEEIAELARKATYKPCAMHMTNLLVVCDSEVIEEMARQLLASMEQEPVSYTCSDALDDVYCGSAAMMGPAGAVGEVPLYAAPQLPQPAVLSVSEGVLKSLLPDVEKSEFWFEHNGKIFFEGVRFNNAVFEACRAAMLQAEPVSNSDELTDGWVACSKRMPSPSTGVIVAAPWQSAPGGYAMKWATNCPGHPDADIDGWIIPGASWSPTHWMPLPAAPQQEDIIC